MFRDNLPLIGSAEPPIKPKVLPTAGSRTQPCSNTCSHLSEPLEWRPALAEETTSRDDLVLSQSEEERGAANTGQRLAQSGLDAPAEDL